MTPTEEVKKDAYGENEVSPEQKMESAGVPVEYDPIMDIPLEIDTNVRGLSSGISLNKEDEEYTFEDKTFTEEEIKQQIKSTLEKLGGGDSYIAGLGNFLDSITPEDEDQSKLDSILSDLDEVEDKESVDKINEIASDLGLPDFIDVSPITPDNLEEIVNGLKSDRFDEKEFITIHDLIGMNVIMPFHFEGTSDSSTLYLTITKEGIDKLSKTAIDTLNSDLQVNKEATWIVAPAKSRCVDGYLDSEVFSEIQDAFPTFKLPTIIDFQYSFTIN